MTNPLSLVWLRRDLRLHDNAALYHALKSGRPVLPVFIFDRTILDALDDRLDRRVEFLVQEINRLCDALAKMKSAIVVRYGHPVDVWKELLTQYNVAEVFTITITKCMPKSGTKPLAPCSVNRVSVLKPSKTRPFLNGTKC